MRRLPIPAAVLASLALVTIIALTSPSPALAPATTQDDITAPQSDAQAAQPILGSTPDATTAQSKAADPAPSTSASATAPRLAQEPETAPTSFGSGAIDHHTVMPVSSSQTHFTNAQQQVEYVCTYVWSDGSTEIATIAVVAGDHSSSFVPSSDCPQWQL